MLFHPSKKYLKYCLSELEKFLEKEKLQLNKKTRIFKSTNNFIFLGRNKAGKYAKHRTINRRLKKQKHLYYANLIPLTSLASSIICYRHLDELK